MKMNYIAPLTETVFIHAQEILEGKAGNMDSGGVLSGESEDLGSNRGSFDVAEEFVPGKGIWED